MTTLVGYRGWRTGPGGALRAFSADAEWAVGENVARCGFYEKYTRVTAAIKISPMLYHDTPPAPHCMCGFWAFSDASYVPNWFWTTLAVGVVEASGRVQRHRLGFRAERARIVALLNPLVFGGDRFTRFTQRVPLELRRASEAYGVPILKRLP